MISHQRPISHTCVYRCPVEDCNSIDLSFASHLAGQLHEFPSANIVYAASIQVRLSAVEEALSRFIATPRGFAGKIFWRRFYFVITDPLYSWRGQDSVITSQCNVLGLWVCDMQGSPKIGRLEIERDLLDKKSAMVDAR